MNSMISERVRHLAEQAQADVAGQFARIDAIAEANTQKVLAAFQRHRVADGYFAGTTGYGYDDLGRDKLDEIYADLFGAEAALVRIQFVNGTHAITAALFGALKAGDVLVSAVGAPYDTLLGVIGVVDKGPGSLKDYGVSYRQVELKDDQPDREGLKAAASDPRVKAVLIQRSKGYSTRSSLSVAEIGELIALVRSVNPQAAVIVDNCYGEFVEEQEPTQVGADLIVGSLIKNPGGGLCGRTAGSGGGRGHAADGAGHRPGVWMHPGTKPAVVPGAVPGPPYGSPGGQDRRVRRTDHGAAGLSDGAGFPGGPARHHSDDLLWSAGAAEAVLQGHSVRLTGGLLRDAGALGHAGL